MNTLTQQSVRAKEPMVQIRNLHKKFGDNPVLRGLDLDIQEGEVLCIVGASGSGKSTLLRCINHLETWDIGTISVDGSLIGYSSQETRDGTPIFKALKDSEVRKQRANMGMVFQNFNLFPHMTVLENIIEAPIQVLKKTKSEAIAIATDLLGLVGLSDKIKAYPRQLSGGQQQRVAIARALAMKPKLMLFDEPTSALDPELVGEVLNTMKALAVSGMTMIVVTHEMEFARDVADTVAFVDAGFITEVGPPDQVLNNPQHPRTQSFLSHIQ